MLLGGKNLSDPINGLFSETGHDAWPIYKLTQFRDLHAIDCVMLFSYWALGLLYLHISLVVTLVRDEINIGQTRGRTHSDRHRN